MSEHISRVIQCAYRRRITGYCAECSCGYRGSTWGTKTNPERERIAHEQRERRAEYVARWRAEHSGLVRDAEWRCPLCNQVIQGSAVGVNLAVQMAIQQHEQWHSQDYLDYLAAGQGGRARGGWELMSDDVYIIYDLRNRCNHPNCKATRTTYVRHRSIAAGWEQEVCDDHVEWAKSQQMKILQGVDR